METQGAKGRKSRQEIKAWTEAAAVDMERDHFVRRVSEGALGWVQRVSPTLPAAWGDGTGAGARWELGELTPLCPFLVMYAPPFPCMHTRLRVHIFYTNNIAFCMVPFGTSLSSLRIFLGDGPL